MCTIATSNTKGRYARWLLLSVVAALLLASCAGNGTDDQARQTSVVASSTPVSEADPLTTEQLDPSPATTAPVATATALDQTEPEAPTQPPAFPDVATGTVAGGQIDFGSLEGQDTVLWFWAPW